MYKLLLLSFLALMWLPAYAQQGPPIPLVTVSGQAEIMVVPDEVVFTLRAVNVDKDLLKAQAANDATIKKALAVARQYGIAAEQVQTSYISIDEKYTEYEDRKPRVFLGYEAEKKIAIILRDVKRAEGLLTDLLKAGLNRIDDIDFRSTKVREYRVQARALAIRAAREKAAAFAAEIGQTIGKAIFINEEGINSNANYAANNVNRNVSTSVSGSYSSEDSAIALGQISITARVTVSFELK